MNDTLVRVFFSGLFLLLYFILLSLKPFFLSSTQDISFSFFFDHLFYFILFLIVLFNIFLSLFYHPQSESKKLAYLLVALILLFFIKTIHLFYLAGGYDEREHLHSAYLVYLGKIPFKDFFQHHNPLYWFMLSPLFHFFSDSTVILAAGAISFLSLLISCLLLYNSVFFLTRKKILALATVLFFLLIPPNFIAYDVRPDVPAATCYFVAFFLLLTSPPERFNLHVSISGFLLALSFLFIQKMAIPILVVSIYIVWVSFIKKRLDALLWFFIPLILPLLFLLLFFYFHKSLDVYLGFAFLFNLLIPFPENTLIRFFTYSLMVAPAFFLGLIGFITETFSLRYLKTNRVFFLQRERGVLVAFFMGSLLCLLPYIFKLRFDFQDYLLPSFFISLFSAPILYNLSKTFSRVSFFLKSLLIFFFVCWIGIYLASLLIFFSYIADDRKDIDFFARNYPHHTAFSCSSRGSFIFNTDASYHWMFPFQFQEQAYILNLPTERRRFEEIISNATIVNIKPCRNKNELLPLLYAHGFTNTSFSHVFVRCPPC